VDSTLRDIFNAHYSEALYRRVCALMEERLAEPDYGFRIAEMPFIVPDDLRAKLEQGAKEILEIIRRPEVVAAGLTAVPSRYRVPGLNVMREPEFVAIDFAVTREDDGSLGPKLIELQGFPSLYGMQLLQGEIWGEVLASIPGMPQAWTPLFLGLSRTDYVELLRRTVVGPAPVDEVILLDLHPEKQKTRPDFHATRQLLGVRTVDATRVVKEGRRVFAPGPAGMTPGVAHLQPHRLRRARAEGREAAVRLARRAGRDLGLPPRLVLDLVQAFAAADRAPLRPTDPLSLRARRDPPRLLAVHPEAVVLVRWHGGQSRRHAGSDRGHPGRPAFAVDPAGKGGLRSGPCAPPTARA
jgi:hypothetical protein